MRGFFRGALLRPRGLSCGDFSSAVDYKLHVGAQGGGCGCPRLCPLVWGIDVMGFDVLSSGA